MSGVLLAAGVSAVTSWFLVATLLRRAGHRLLDRPNERSMHAVPTPRGGGLAIALALALGILVVPSPRGAAQATLLLLVAGTGMLDDLRSLSWRVRLGVHVLAAGASMWLWGWFQSVSIGDAEWGLGVVGLALTFVWIVGLINAYNFMDGIDGIAGGQALVALGLWSAAAALAGRLDLSLTLSVGFGATAGFLVWNWSPARIFMGDVGSTTLGYFLAVLPLVAVDDGVVTAAVAPWLALGVVFPFVYDAAATFTRRALRRENVLAPHRTHTYQLLAQRVGHRPVAFAWSALAAVSGGAGLLFARGELPGSAPSVAAAAVVVAIEAARSWSSRAMDEGRSTHG